MVVLDRFRVYITRDFVYIVGSQSKTRKMKMDKSTTKSQGQEVPSAGAEDGTRFRLLRIEKALTGPTKTFADCVYQDPKEYGEKELAKILEGLAQGNKRTGGLRRVVDAVAIVGCVKFMKGYYLVLITNSTDLGEIDGHVVYGAKGSELVPLFDTSIGTPRGGWAMLTGATDPETMAEDEFKNLFRLVDLTKSFYWSYTYNMGISLQRNVASQVLKRTSSIDNSIDKEEFDDQFIWNSFLLQPLLKCLKKEQDNDDDDDDQSILKCPWVIPLIHGSFKQQRCSILSRSLTLTLIGRRSRHYAGTRYLKRGVNDNGYVANDVEIEQVVHDHMPLSGNITSYVQVRGSIPTFWSQETSVASPRPPIKRLRFDPWYNATRVHFADLLRRYGDSILVLNLVKQTEKRKRETIVGNDFKHAMEHLNSTLPQGFALEYRAVDFTRLSKADPSSLLRALDNLATEAMNDTSFFSWNTSHIPDPSPDFDTKLVRQMKVNMLNSKMFGYRRKRKLLAKVPMRWSSRSKRYVPMRMNTVFQMYTTSKQARKETGKQDDDDDDDDDDGDNSKITERLLSQGQELLQQQQQQQQRLQFQKLKGSTKDPNNTDNTGLGFGMSLEFPPLALPPVSLPSPSLNQDDEDLDDEDDVQDGYDSDELDGDANGYSYMFQTKGPSTPIQGKFTSPLFTDRSSGSRKSILSSSKQQRQTDRIQRGIIRTNCIDCLDRTNLAQFLIGLHVLGEQLVSMGIISKGEKIGTDSTISTLLMEMYEELGDRIALQYGGSDAHRKGGKLMSNASSTSRQQALFTSLKRYYSNAFTDHAKQDAINVFLGSYRSEHKIKPAESSEFYLHNRAVTNPPNFTLEPLALQLGEWWRRPLDSFAKQVLIPLSSVYTVTSSLVAKPDGVVSSPHTSAQKKNMMYEPESFLGSDGSEITSFDSILSRPYYQPRQLTVPGFSDTAFESKSPRGSAYRKSSLFSNSSSVTSSPLGPKPRTWSSSESVSSVETHSSNSSSVYHSLRTTLFGSSASLSKFRLPETPASSGSEAGSLNSSTSGEQSSSQYRDQAIESRAEDLEPVYRDYIRQYYDPWSMYSGLYDSWDQVQHRNEYGKFLSDYQIDQNDGWGMRRLQAYSSCTSIIMCGPFKGYPQTMQAAALSLELEQIGMMK